MVKWELPGQDVIMYKPKLTVEELAALLHQVVMAVINKGHASDLYDLDDVLDYFGARNPEKDP